jgi:hypothetical protein
VDPRAESVARNEALLRQVNEHIERLSAGVEERGWTPGGRIEFVCECGRECDLRLLLSHEEYDDVHTQADRFVVAPEHVTRDIEVVVARTDRYVVVDKLPAVERLVGADGLPSSEGRN